MVAIDEEIARDSLFDAIFALGINFLGQGKYEKALIIFDGLIALDPMHPMAAIAYGEALLMDGQLKKACEHFLRVVEKYERDCRINLSAARACILSGKDEEARSLLRPIIEEEIFATRPVIVAAKLMFKDVESHRENVNIAVS